MKANLNYENTPLKVLEDVLESEEKLYNEYKKDFKFHITINIILLIVIIITSYKVEISIFTVISTSLIVYLCMHTLKLYPEKIRELDQEIRLLNIWISSKKSNGKEHF